MCVWLLGLAVKLFRAILLFLVIRGHLRPLNHCPKWEIRQVCPIWGNFFIEATSDPFWQEICCDSGASAALQSTPPMGRTSSTTHRWLFRVSATSAPLSQQIGVCRWVGRELGRLGKIGRLGRLVKLVKLRSGVRSKGAPALLKFLKLPKFL